jgi:sulfur transfer protein SufE
VLLSQIYVVPTRLPFFLWAIGIQAQDLAIPGAFYFLANWSREYTGLLGVANELEKLEENLGG